MRFMEPKKLKLSNLIATELSQREKISIPLEKITDRAPQKEENFHKKKIIGTQREK